MCEMRINGVSFHEKKDGERKEKKEL